MRNGAFGSLPRGCAHSIGCEDLCAATNVPGVVSERPVLAAACDFVAVGVDCDDATAGEGADVWFSVFIEDNVPRRDGTRPILKDAIEGLSPLGVVRLGIGLGDVRAPLGPIGILVGEGIVNSGHRRRLAYISVPGNTVNVFGGFRNA